MHCSITLHYMWQLCDMDHNPSMQNNATLVQIKEELDRHDEDIENVYAMAAAVGAYGLDLSTVKEAHLLSYP